jgi:uncharacterized protein (TIGR03083 family)
MRGRINRLVEPHTGWQDGRMSIPDRATADYAGLFEVERDRLLRVLDSLDPEDWDRDSPCPGWTVLGLTCHLLGGDLSTLSRQRDGHFGTEPPDGLADNDSFARWLDRLQDDWVTAARRISPRLVIDLLRHTGPQLAAHFRSQDPSARTARVSWAGPDAAPVWLDQGRELTEYWIHRQQLQIATNRGELETDLTGAVLDALRWAYPYRLGQLARPDGEAVVIEIHGAVDRRWTLQWHHGDCAFVDSAGGPVVARLTMSTDQAWRLLSNNLDPRAQQDLAFSGDPEVIAMILRTRAIIGVPNISP